MAAPTQRPVQHKSFGQQPIDQVIGDYRILRVMSRGSLGTLHVAEDSNSGALVLVRVLPRKLTAMPKIRSTLERDLDRLQRIQHRNVTRVHTHGVIDGRAYYVLDFPSSLTLHDYVHERGPLKGIELLWLAAGLSSGLAALHQEGLPHGNLWPAKVALTRLGPVLVDLSWSSRLRGSEPTPEADLEALAATLIYAATGKLPAADERSKVHPLPRGVPGPVLRLLDAARRPAERRPKAAEVARELQSQVDELLLEGSGALEPLYDKLEQMVDVLPGLQDPREESGGIPLPAGFEQLQGNPTMVERPSVEMPPRRRQTPRTPLTRPDLELEPAVAAPAPAPPPKARQDETTESGLGDPLPAPPPKTPPPRKPARRRNKATSPPDVHRLRPGLSVQQIRLLGEGGMGVVHLVRDPLLQRQAALKLVRGASRIRLSRFQRETVVTARLDHPSIPPVFEAGVTGDDEPYLLMRFVDGESLSEILDRRPPDQALDDEETRRLLQALIRVGEAVSFAHSRRIVHRDLKPANIMIGAFGEVFVMDWGLARDLSESAEEDLRARSELASALDSEGPQEGPAVQGLTQEGTILGTPGYMAPEQARGEDVDAQTDVFALGAILCEILTGRPPFTGPTPLAVLGLNRAGEVEFPSQRFRDVNPELDAIARKALAPETEDRYLTTAEFVADLRAFVEGRPVSVYAYNKAERAWRWMRDHPTMVSSGLAILFLALGIPLALLRARAAKVDDLLDQGQVALNQRHGTEAARLFKNAIDLDANNHVAHLGLREAKDLEKQAEREQRKKEAQVMIDQGNECLAVGDLEGARGWFQRAQAFEHPDAGRLLGQVEQAIDELRDENEEAELQRRAREQGQKHRASGLELMQHGQLEEAQAEFIKAIAFGANQAREDLLKLEGMLLEKRDQDRLRRRAEESRQLTEKALTPLEGRQSSDLQAVEKAREKLIMALALDPKNKRAREGMAWVDRRARNLERRAEQARREQEAGKELGIGRRTIRQARTMVEQNVDPEDIRETYLDALAAYDRAQFLLPDHTGIHRERAAVTREFADLLVNWGQQDLAAYFLRSSGIDPDDASQSPVAPLQDDVVTVDEADLPEIRQAYGGGAVRIQPTHAFDALREQLHDLGERYKVLIQVRSDTTSDQPPKVLVKGFWVKVTDTETGTVYPTIQIVFEGGPFIRPVVVTANGHRLITPWNRAHNLDEDRYTKAVVDGVMRQIGAAKHDQR